MAEGFSTESEGVAATFAAMELTKLIIGRLGRVSLHQDLRDIDQIYTAVFASIRGAQAAPESDDDAASLFAIARPQSMGNITACTSESPLATTA